MPLPSLDAVTAGNSQCASFTGNSRRQQKHRLAYGAALQVWLFLTVLYLNFEALLGTWPKLRPPSLLTKAQAKALDSLSVSIAYFLTKPLQKLEIEHPKHTISTKGLDYSGAEVRLALPLIAEEIEPGLPEPGVAASIDILPLCDPLVAEWVASPEARLLPKADCALHQ